MECHALCEAYLQVACEGLRIHFVSGLSFGLVRWIDEI